MDIYWRLCRGRRRRSFLRYALHVSQSTCTSIPICYWQIALQPTDAIRSIWSPDFKLDYTVLLTASTLETRLTVSNPGSTPFRFQALLHNYLRVSAVTEAAVGPLAQRTYVDKPDGAKVKREQNDWIRLEAETDRVYKSTGDLILKTDKHGPLLKLTKSNFPDAVVWNPGQAKGETIGDLERGGWLVAVSRVSAPLTRAGPREYFVCVEPGHIDFVELAARQSWTGTQRLETL
jgi:glucose-6-phosphate 1-epimerase